MGAPDAAAATGRRRTPPANAAPPSAGAPSPADAAQVPTLRDPRLARKMADFVRQRLGDRLAPRELQSLQAYLMRLARSDARLPARGRGFDWRAIATACGVAPDQLAGCREALTPGLRLLQRELARPRPRRRAGPGRPPSPLEEFPTPDPGPWPDPPAFHRALALHMRRHGDSRRGLARWLKAKGLPTDQNTLATWLRGEKAPTHRDSFTVLKLLEVRWRLPAGYFREKLPHPARSAVGHAMPGVPDVERRQLAWHLPDDFEARAPEEQEEILTWVRRVVVQGATDYRRFQSLAVRVSYGLRFPQVHAAGPRSLLAPPALSEELRALLDFKTNRFVAVDQRRRGVWNPETAEQRASHLGLWFGALAAHPQGAVRGHGVPHEALTFALMVLPQVWEWLIGWRERRRGFFTVGEKDMLDLARSLTSPDTGWLTQSPHLAGRLRPIPGLVTEADIARVRADWAGACRTLHRYAEMRRHDVRRLMRVHHDPFEPILPVLSAQSPASEYRRIADEILRLRPCAQRYPRSAAQNERAYLMVRLGLHLGFRQKNLRQLLICRPGQAPRSERALEDLQRGQLLRCDEGWVVTAPTSAFKNGRSRFFNGRPYRLRLPDVAGLYDALDHYVADARPRLLAGAEDPGTLFVKTATTATADVSFSANRFYGAWRWIIQRYGIYNPWTGRGAIEGLLPHGPHSVRDVLATHILKQTGSYEQASYAIQSTPETVARHYARFLPQDKAEVATQLLDHVWR